MSLSLDINLICMKYCALLSQNTTISSLYPWCIWKTNEGHPIASHKNCTSLGVAYRVRLVVGLYSYKMICTSRTSYTHRQAWSTQSDFYASISINTLKLSYWYVLVNTHIFLERYIWISQFNRTTLIKISDWLVKLDHTAFFNWSYWNIQMDSSTYPEISYWINMFGSSTFLKRSYRLFF